MPHTRLTTTSSSTAVIVKLSDVMPKLAVLAVALSNWKLALTVASLLLASTAVEIGCKTAWVSLLP